MSDVIILGGGISGLASAYFLSKKGLSSTIVEAAPRLGGLIRTDTVRGCQLEAGPDSYISTKPEATRLAHEVSGLGNEIIGTNDAARRIFVVRNGTLVPFPAGMVLMAPGNMRAVLESELFSNSTKCALLRERFYKPREREQDISVAEFVTDHFDSSILEYVTEPLLTGVYGGEAAKLSARSVLPRFLEYERTYGSLVRAVRKERKNAAANNSSLFLSFRRGMQSLPDGLARAAAASITSVHGEATAVEKRSGRWAVTIGRSIADAKFLIMALPAHRAAPLFEKSFPALAGELSAIPYTSAISVNLVFDRSSVERPLDGFGFLVPRSERRQIAAATWINTKFPERVAQGFVALRAFIVDRDADTLHPESNETIVGVARAEFQRLMGINASPVASVVARWPLSMPQYVVGHAASCRRIRALTAQESGLFLVGNAYEGVGIPDCIRLAQQAVAQIDA
ncbi:MAG TPA: protoporphyrinogen oxidase [Bryobacteraceae bacterium]|nr:protoporphyrinogen oxidase [Bryobacteraceae bacterium]